MQLTYFISFIIFFIGHNVINAAYNECQVASNCSQCITLSTKCAWCDELLYKSSTSTTSYHKKCDIEENHKKQGCKSIHNPKSSADITKSAELEGDTRVSPQAIKVKLRPGQSTSVNVKIKTPKNFPIDLYYLMDLSISMQDDLEQIGDLSVRLSKEMNKVTENFRLGFGGYVDKPLGPFTVTSPKEIKSYKDKYKNSQYTFGFKNYLKLNSDPNEFQKTVRNVNISFNVDAPEGSLEALMQVLVCQKAIGWRDKRKARRIVIITTDQTFHFSGDGLLGGVVIPNDASCQLKNDYEYTAWNKYDYPSLSQIRDIMIDSQIAPIFASLGNDELYAEVAKFFGQQSGAVAQRLANDSSNIVPLIKESYEKIAKKVSIISTAPNGIDVKFTTNCGDDNKDPVESSSCNNVAIGQEVSFITKITANDCKLSGKDTTFKLKTDFDDIDVTLEMLCDCPCEEKSIVNSPACNGRGTESCGICTCNDGFAGRLCQCTDAEAKNASLCRAPGQKGEVCGGEAMGTCECGECICEPPQLIEETGNIMYIYGDQCECTNTSCAKSNGFQICGGPERGVCDCGVCICKDNWAGEACGESCPKSEENCIGKDGSICNNKGRCVCNKCECDEGYVGEQCEQCLARCPDPCEDYKECVKCLAFDTSELTVEECHAECAKYNISTEYEQVERIDDNQKRCIARDEDDCSFVFTYNKSNDTNELVMIIVQNERICPAEADIVAIILGVIAGIVGIGLALLLIWKLLATIQDRREFAQFDKDRQNPKWDSGMNPIYKGATSTFQNPMYGDKKPLTSSP